MTQRLNHIEYTKKIIVFLEKLSIPYVDVRLYEHAFVHRSVLNERYTKFREHNERLEFLGDAVLELIMTDILYHQFPEKQEGWMTDTRSSMVRGKNLARIAQELGFQDFLLLSYGERQANGQTNPSLLADTFEAFLGAIYLDAGLIEAVSFVKKHVYATLEDIMRDGEMIDPKTSLQELTQARFGVTPLYTLRDEQGQDHKKQFFMEVSIEGQKIGSGVGSSKKKSQESAAIDALSKKDIWMEKILKK